ncbi:MAG TPA: hypothetical protein VGO91_12090 [Pyrinomonadaceae bacterium]|jgi:hypothetical protein|nr:hypothetical protein [Pyrinomonadaceae bacterium]
MQSFSQRKGLKPIKSIMQVDSMDEDLRNGLWNALKIFYWNKADESPFVYHLPSISDIYLLLVFTWRDYFKKPIENISNDWNTVRSSIKNYFFGCTWNEAYDFIEFIANTYKDESQNKEFMEFCNYILEREISAYRFVAGQLTQITSEEEVNSIEEALNDTNILKPVNNHLKTSLNLLSDRKSPDYRNSIKESISAVEAMCNIINGSKGTLGQALKQLEAKVALHPALKSAFSNLYGYTSDANGIRHALLDEPDLDFEDAKYMLVSCSAFINYLISKAAKAGITF